MVIFVMLVAVGVLVHYHWHWIRLREEGRGFAHPAEHPLALLVFVGRRLRHCWSLPVLLVVLWAAQGLIPLFWPYPNQPAPGGSASLGHANFAMPSGRMATPPGASVGHWYSPESGPLWSWHNARSSFLADWSHGGAPLLPRVLEALPGSYPRRGWLHLVFWLQWGLVAATLVLLVVWLARPPSFLHKETRRRLPGVFAFVLVLLGLNVAAALFGDRIFGRAGPLPVLRRETLPQLTFLGLAILSTSMSALLEGLLWAAAWRAMVYGRYRLSPALATALRRFWPIFGLLVLYSALVWLPEIVAEFWQWARDVLYPISYYARPLVSAALLFVPWALLRRPRRSLRWALAENFSLLRKHRRPLGWFALRFTALTLVVMEVSTALVGGIHPGVISGLLGLAPTLFLWAASLTVPLVYATLVGVRIAREQVPVAAPPKEPA